MNKPYIIAELGVNFYDTAKILNISPMDAAKKYILEAKKVGINAVKFQSYKANTIVSKNSPSYWDLTQEPTKSQYELFKKFDSFNKEDYEELHRYCKEIGIDFMSTPFDYHSADYLYNMVDIYKISSSDLSNIPFLKYISQKGKPIYLSVGASYLEEIKDAVNIMLDEGCQDIALLHCVLSYPTKYEDANLNIIKTLKKEFPTLKIGYSDHTLPDDTMTVLTTAYLYGAEIIEKHFTLDKTLKGNDHYHAGNPDDFKKAIENFELISKISGQYEKNVLECENVPRRQARRSLVINKNLASGHFLTLEDISIKRPGTGIAPKDLEKVIEKKLVKDIQEDTILSWDMLSD